MRCPALLRLPGSRNASWFFSEDRAKERLSVFHLGKRRHRGSDNPPAALWQTRTQVTSQGASGFRVGGIGHQDSWVPLAGLGPGEEGDWESGLLGSTSRFAADSLQRLGPVIFCVSFPFREAGMMVIFNPCTDGIWSARGLSLQLEKSKFSPITMGTTGPAPLPGHGSM